MYSQSKRGQRAGRRLDITEIREALLDDRTWCGLGLVEKRESHFHIEENDVLVEVRLMPGNQPILCRLGAAAGGPGQGVWMIPPVGSEVAVLIPDGELEADCMIVATLSSGAVPDGLVENTMVVVSPNVLIHDGVNAGAEALVKKSEFAAHVHSIPPLSVPNAVPAGPGSPVTVAAPSLTPTAPITGTTVLKAK